VSEESLCPQSTIFELGLLVFMKIVALDISFLMSFESIKDV